MQFPDKTTVINARAVALEMMMLLAYTLLLGVAVSVLVAMPVLLLYATAS